MDRTELAEKLKEDIIQAALKENSQVLAKAIKNADDEWNKTKKRTGLGDEAKDIGSVVWDSAIRTLFRRNLVTVDRLVFKLHYQVTASLLLIACAIITATQFFGKPIACFLPTEFLDFPVKVVETYCWAEGTFTVPKGLNSTVGNEIPYMGINKKIPGDEVIHHAYYQWVSLVLFLQAVCFVFPHFLWSSWESYNIYSILRGLQRPLVPTRTWAYSGIYSDLTNKDFSFRVLFRKYLLCQFLCLVNVIGQIFVMDAFLGGRFYTFGVDVFNYANGNQEVDPMRLVFPRMSKCTFHQFGPSGDVQKLDTVCVLPLNILNEKIYVAFWFWSVILAILTGLDFAWCLLAALTKRVRCTMTIYTNLGVNSSDLRTVVGKLDAEQWFLLHMLGVNMDRLYFRELVRYVRVKIDESEMT